MPVTDLASTTWDCLRTSGPLAALVVADSALHAGLSRDCVLAVAEQSRGNGTARARALLALADDGAESARETWARFAFALAGWPPPETQVRVETARGTYWADFGWPRWRLLIEYDGLGKYIDDPTRLLAEKLRRDAIAEAGWRSVHVTKADSLHSVVARTRPYVPDGALAHVRVRRDLLLPSTP